MFKCTKRLQASKYREKRLNGFTSMFTQTKTLPLIKTKWIYHTVHPYHRFFDKWNKNKKCVFHYGSHPNIHYIGTNNEKLSMKNEERGGKIKAHIYTYRPRIITSNNYHFREYQYN